MNAIMDRAERLLNRVRAKTEQYRKIYLALFFFGLIVYSVFMAFELTNNADGLWQQNYYMTVDWEREEGRWLWPEFERFLFGVHTDPVSTIFSLSLYTAGLVVILNLIPARGFCQSFLFGAAVIASTGVSGALGYRFMSYVYGFSFLFSVLASFVLARVKKTVPAVLGTAVLITLSMGLYQAYLACMLVVSLAVLILRLGDREIRLKDDVLYLVRMAAAVIVGGLTYIFLAHEIPKLYGGSLGTYLGVGSTTPLSILAALPERLLFTWRQFADYYFRNYLTNSVLTPHGLYYVVFAALIAAFAVYAVRITRADQWGKAVLLIICLFVLPVAENISLILAPESALFLQMSVADCLLVPIMFLLAMRALPENTGMGKLSSAAGVLLMCAVLYGNTMQIEINQAVMRQGYTATETLLGNVMTDLERRGMLSAQNEYFFIGRPCDNPLFYKTPLYDRAGEYARVGDSAMEDRSMQAAFQGLIQKRLGINVPISSHDYEDIAYSDFLKDMPVFPAEGYCQNWDGFIVVKLARPR